jgi:glycosyltransferase involved in cell wall biosynthesis
MVRKRKKYLKPKIIIALNAAWNLYNFRSGLISFLLKNDFDVVGIAPEDEYVPRVKALGCRFINVKMSPKGLNPFQDIRLLFQYYKIFRSEKPDFFLGFTVKPNIYGSIIAHLLKVPVINNIAGLGIVFQKNNLLTKFVLCLYCLALKNSRKVFFQNADDRHIFVKKFKFLKSKSGTLPGSGVDLKKFSLVPLKNKKTVNFLMIARLLSDKGVIEYVEAARILKNSNKKVEFLLLGYLDQNDKSYVTYKQLQQWTSDRLIKYLGSSDDVRIQIEQADCIVLPSYYPEGTPRVLLEAAAMGRPLITTNTKGCRNVVDDGLSGFICAPKDSADLAEKIKKVVELDHYSRTKMGELGRKKIEQEFDEAIVCRKYLREISSIC